MTKAGRRAAVLPVAFFTQPTAEVAAGLLGAVMTSTVGGERTAGIIVETEAYLGRDDPASHAYRGRLHARNAALYGPPGTWYVYLSYGMHWCANLVCESEGLGGAVLIRALEPIEGLDLMRRRRGGVADRLLCAGPGRLCQALGMNVELDGRPMAGSDVVVTDGTPPPPEAIVATPRIGITRAAEWPLRFALKGSRYLSRAAVAPE